MARAKRLFWGLYGILLALIIGMAGVGLWYRFGVVPGIQSSLVPASAPRSSVNAVWMEHAWVDPGKSEQEVTALARELRTLGFTDAFFHAGPLAGDGTLASSRYPGAKTMLNTLHRAEPDLRAQAWIGQVATTWGGPMDITKEETRANIVASAEQLLDVGFDGIHLNIEPILDDDPHFLQLLAALREKTHERQKLLSIASDDVEPFFGAEFLIRSCCRAVTIWRPAYLAKVFGYVDQVAIMTYDASLKDDLFYSWYVSLMTKRLAPLVPEDKTLFMGIPSYETGNRAFDPTVENIWSGLRGVIAGLDNADVQGTLGVALYAYWETSEEEWDAYATYWLGKH